MLSLIINPNPALTVPTLTTFEFFVAILGFLLCTLAAAVLIAVTATKSEISSGTSRGDVAAGILLVLCVGAVLLLSALGIVGAVT